MNKVISNTSPLIALSNISRLELLKELFQKIIIPKAVYHEVVEKGNKRPGSIEVENAIRESWIEIKEVKNTNGVKALKTILDYGEAEVISLSQEIKADLLILDNKEPRIFAKHLGLKVIGTIGIITLAYKKGIIENPFYEILMLKEKGFYISDKLLNEIRNYLK